MHHGGVCGAELRGIYKGLVPVVSVGRGLAPGDGLHSALVVAGAEEDEDVVP